jgi:hypothetical protein
MSKDEKTVVSKPKHKRKRSEEDPDYVPGDEVDLKELNVIQSDPRPKRKKSKKTRSTDTGSWTISSAGEGDDDITQFDEEEAKQIAEHKEENKEEEQPATTTLPTCDCELETVDGTLSDEKAPATLITVKKEGPTQGQQFWGCANPNWKERCKFFLWDSDFQSGHYKAKQKAAKPVDVKKTHRKKEVCLCGDKAIAKRSTTPANPNKVFWSCPTRACKFFRWDDS